MEQQVEVEIVADTTTARYGSLSIGAILRTDAKYAAHLVDDCMAAKYQVPNAAAADVQTSALNDPHLDLGTLVAVASGVAAETDFTGAVAADAVHCVQTSAQIDPYAHLGTLIAAVPNGEAIAGDMTGTATAGGVDEQGGGADADTVGNASASVTVAPKSASRKRSAAVAAAAQEA